jgi:hypothetical protein
MIFLIYFWRIEFLKLYFFKKKKRGTCCSEITSTGSFYYYLQSRKHFTRNNLASCGVFALWWLSITSKLYLFWSIFTGTSNFCCRFRNIKVNKTWPLADSKDISSTHQPVQTPWMSDMKETIMLICFVLKNHRIFVIAYSTLLIVEKHFLKQFRVPHYFYFNRIDKNKPFLNLYQSIT